MVRLLVLAAIFIIAVHLVQVFTNSVEIIGATYLIGMLSVGLYWGMYVQRYRTRVFGLPTPSRRRLALELALGVVLLFLWLVLTAFEGILWGTVAPLVFLASLILVNEIRKKRSRQQ